MEDFWRCPPIPRTTHPAFDAQGLQRLQELLHQSPRDYGQDVSLWTFIQVVEVSYELDLTDHVVSYETIGRALAAGQELAAGQVLDREP